ncbi:folate transporter 1, chloroplastic isoform X3 [Eucalyptus grandis]|uniref:folate transporter 1, chloroplastic isoform X3 n=1 Tax=Eucalyptus grandis TaxID=71139 RepID=UPI00192E8F76|nr:folate transporter 1, chloroplastic isoform X3 [Eucalyptus grandis]
MSQPRWQWENAAAGALAGLATVAATHPLDVVRTRFQANDGRVAYLPTYRNTAQALFTIARSEGLRGLYAGFLPAVLGSSLSWGLYFFFYGRAKKRYSAKREESLSPGLHLASAAEAGALVSLCTHPVWLIKTRLQLQNPLHRTRAYSGFYGLPHTLHWLPNNVISEIPIFEFLMVLFTSLHMRNFGKLLSNLRRKEGKRGLKGLIRCWVISGKFEILGDIHFANRPHSPAIHALPAFRNLICEAASKSLLFDELVRQQKIRASGTLK